MGIQSSTDKMPQQYEIIGLAQTQRELHKSAKRWKITSIALAALGVLIAAVAVAAMQMISLATRAPIVLTGAVVLSSVLISIAALIYKTKVLVTLNPEQLLEKITSPLIALSHKAKEFVNQLAKELPKDREPISKSLTNEWTQKLEELQKEEASVHALMDKPEFEDEIVALVALAADLGSESAKQLKDQGQTPENIFNKLIAKAKSSDPLFKSHCDQIIQKLCIYAFQTLSDGKGGAQDNPQYSSNIEKIYTYVASLSRRLQNN